MAVTRNGATLFVAALGSDKVGVFSTAQLETDSFVPSAASQIHVSGGGPTGLALDEDRGQLFVLTRFDDAISVIDTRTRTETAHVAMHNPEPPSITTGRRFLYDASFSSGHGDSACASCHVFGDFDSLAWDLGNPDEKVTPDPGPFASTLFNLITQQPMAPIFHPMKGPMTTQSLRGMLNSGPMHWRGDRTAGVPGVPSAQPDTGAFDERAAFGKFQAGFTDLLGRSAVIPAADMDAFTDFILQVSYPPNPNQPLDRSFTPDQEAGRQLFTGTNCGIPAAEGPSVTLTCTSCHLIDPGANPGTAAPGFFGTSGLSSFDFNPQLFKTPHLRNLYQKIGMFGAPPTFGFPGVDNDPQGDQVRGFGFLNDGDLDTVFRFHHGISFSEGFNGGPGHGGLLDGPEGELQRRQLEAFVLAFPTNLAPIVGQQVTLTADSPPAVAARADLLRRRADAGDCELVAKSTVAGAEAGFLYVGSGRFRPDRRAAPPIPDAALRLLARLGHPVTLTCVPPGSGQRIGVDRDGDGAWDGDERDARTDPADPNSTP
jgi:hypothetical protein